MLWCSKNYVKSLDDIIHHKELKETLCNCKYNELMNILFYGVKGCGKKSIVKAYVNNLITSYFNIKLEDIHEVQKEVKCKTNKKYEMFKYTKAKYYYIIDMLKLGKKHIHFFDQFLKYIIQSKNVLNLPFNLIIIYNYDICNLKLAHRFKTYSEKYYKYTRFICITNKPGNTDESGLKLIGYVKVRVPQLTKKETTHVLKDIIYQEMPSIKTHTASFEKKMETIIDYSNNHLAKSIFYAQLLFQFGAVQFKNIALRENRRFEYIYSLITSKNIKNLQDINKVKNTTRLTDPSNLKLKRLIYQCTMNTENYEDLIVGFYKFLIKHKISFIEKYNKQIVKLVNNICIAHTNTNKTSFIIVECFFIKLMTMYSLDNMKPT
jgi:DNA polymerase III delta prime subunit